MENIQLNPKTQSENSFWKAINVLIKKPHVVNKRLWGTTILYKHVFNYLPESFERILDHVKLVSGSDAEQTFNKLVKDLNGEKAEEIKKINIELMLVELLPKNYCENHAFQLIYVHQSELKVKFIDVTPIEKEQNLCPSFSYTFVLKNNEITLETSPGQ